MTKNITAAFFEKDTSKSNITVSNNSFNIGHCMSMKLITGNMQRIQHVNVNIPVHPVLVYSDTSKKNLNMEKKVIYSCNLFQKV